MGRYLDFGDQAAFRGASHEAQALAGCAIHPGARLLARLAERWWTRYRVAAWLTKTADSFIGLHPRRDPTSNYPPLSRYLGLAPRVPAVLWDTATDWPMCIECGCRRARVAGYVPEGPRPTEDAFLFCLQCCRAALDPTRRQLAGRHPLRRSSSLAGGGQSGPRATARRGKWRVRAPGETPTAMETWLGDGVVRLFGSFWLCFLVCPGAKKDAARDLPRAAGRRRLRHLR